MIGGALRPGCGPPFLSARSGCALCAHPIRAQGDGSAPRQQASDSRQQTLVSQSPQGILPRDPGLLGGIGLTSRDLGRWEASLRPCTGQERRVVAAAGASHDDRISGTSRAPPTWLRSGHECPGGGAAPGRRRSGSSPTCVNWLRSTAVAPQSSRRPRLPTTSRVSCWRASSGPTGPRRVTTVESRAPAQLGEAQPNDLIALDDPEQVVTSSIGRRPERAEASILVDVPLALRGTTVRLDVARVPVYIERLRRPVVEEQLAGRHCSRDQGAHNRLAVNDLDVLQALHRISLRLDPGWFERNRYRSIASSCCPGRRQVVRRLGAAAAPRRCRTGSPSQKAMPSGALDVLEPLLRDGASEPVHVAAGAVVHGEQVTTRS